MKRYAALLRGVSPMNCKMPALARAFEAAGFSEVKTLLSSGNVVFSGSGTERALQKKAEAAMQEHLGRSFLTFVRPVAALQALLDADPYAAFRLAPGSKRVVTFLPAVPEKVPPLPIASEGARILVLRDRELLSTYVPGPKGGAFMGVIERAFGKDVTTRTWDTVAKISAAG
ncbi:DUF1697 domain-containing protein [Ramlibacter terrae]|uniref:DUF1697 domain-containing protein n=1 Tax=Ramlibacter terrae TaxID=2732511 RepID=A0ABX6P3A2_9BURK|nr:DUF1697 domain-containing protein [Ramlibacter terrae]